MTFLAHLSYFASVGNKTVTKISSVCVQISRNGMRNDRFEYFLACNVII